MRSGYAALFVMALTLLVVVRSRLLSVNCRWVSVSADWCNVILLDARYVSTVSGVGLDTAVSDCICNEDRSPVTLLTYCK